MIPYPPSEQQPGFFATAAGKITVIVVVALLVLAGIGATVVLLGGFGSPPAPVAPTGSPSPADPCALPGSCGQGLPPSDSPGPTRSDEPSPSQSSCPDGITPPAYVDAEVCGPIPANAADLAAFGGGSTMTTADGNIECELGEADAEYPGYAYCQIGDYDFDPPTDEEGIESSAMMLDTDASVGSPSDAGDIELPKVPTGTAVAVGDIACRFGTDEVACWNSKTGHGVYLSREHMAGW